MTARVGDKLLADLLTIADGLDCKGVVWRWEDDGTVHAVAADAEAARVLAAFCAIANPHVVAGLIREAQSTKAALEQVRRWDDSSDGDLPYAVRDAVDAVLEPTR